MTSKEYEFLYGLYCYYHKNHFRLKDMENPEKDCWEKIGKDLEEKELLETELKLEKGKVKYVMKQLEKQDKILNAFKNYIKISSDGIISCHDFIIIPIFVSKEHEERYNLLKEWLDEKNE